MEKNVADAIEAFFDHCLDREEMDDDYHDWVHQHTDGTAWDQGIDADDLISLADEGLEHYGDYEVTSKEGFRSAIAAMAYYGYTSQLGSEISDWVHENDLDDLGRIVRNDPHEGSWDEEDEEECVYIYFEDEEDDDYEAWQHMEVKIGEKDVTFWVDVTDTYELSNIIRLKRAVEHGREEEEGVG